MDKFKMEPPSFLQDGVLLEKFKKTGMNLDNIEECRFSIGAKMSSILSQAICFVIP